MIELLDGLREAGLVADDTSDTIAWVILSYMGALLMAVLLAILALVPRILVRVAGGIDWACEWIGRGVSWLALLMVLVTFVVVVLRYLFAIGWIAMQESVTYMHAVLFMIGAAYTLQHDGHVRVDLLYRPLPPRGKALVNLLGTLLLLVPVCLFIFSISWEYVAASWSLQEGSREAGGLDLVWLLKAVILLMAAMVLLQGFSQSAHALLQLFRRETAADGEWGS